VFGLIISVGSLVALVVQYGQLETTARLVLLFIGCLFTVIQPVMLYTKAKAQVAQNENINAALHYKLTEDNIVVSQGEQEVVVEWDEVRRRVVTGKAVYLYMSPVRAFIFPANQCGTSFQKICELADKQGKRHKRSDAQIKSKPQREQKKQVDQEGGKL
jgi:hypothetical protein